MFVIDFGKPTLAECYAGVGAAETYALEVVQALTIHPYMVEAPFAGTKLKDENARWRVISSLQKSIRRGDLMNAWRAASALQVSGQETQMWRRLAVICFEDIGFGNLHICAAVALLASRKRMRNKYDPLGLLYCAVRLMCEAVKSRAACDLANTTADQDEFKAKHAWDEPAKLVALWRDMSLPLNQRITALFLLCGIKIGDSYTKKFNEILSAELGEVTDHPILQTIIQRALTGEGLILAVTLLIAWGMCEAEKPTVKHIDLGEPRMSGALPSVAYDMHSRDGIWAIRVLLKRNKKFHKLLLESMKFSEEDVNVYRIFCMVLFMVETELLDKFVMTKTSVKILADSRINEMNDCGVHISFLPFMMGTVNNMIEDLNGCRDWVVKQVKSQVIV